VKITQFLLILRPSVEFNVKSATDYKSREN